MAKAEKDSFLAENKLRPTGALVKTALGYEPLVYGNSDDPQIIEKIMAQGERVRASSTDPTPRRLIKTYVVSGDIFKENHYRSRMNEDLS